MAKHKRGFLNKQRALTAAARADVRTGLQHKTIHCRDCKKHHVTRILVDGKPVKVNTRNLIPKVVKLREPR